MLIGLRFLHTSGSTTAQSKFSATENFNYDPKADLRNGLTQAHPVFTCHTATQPFVQTLSPGHKAGMLAVVTCLSPQVLICPPPSNGHFTPQPERSDYPANEGWQLQDEIQALANCHPWDSNSKNPPNSPQQDFPIPHMPCEQTLGQPTPGSSGSQWLEDLFCEPSQNNEPPIPGPSQASEPHEDPSTCEPEPEVASTQSTEEPF
ncbi:hypothetical protein O181_018678 [Austropuccinia psidii MF-1]|uniref:Uncharacterized protein n=1 Tax=Austropuccinia psidii MF-1 TaxID=1389203 RepID=A0A9Q3C9J0_9BASI|nr:hypothetical protein [Austropuccinia psidii MF-1]